MEFKAKSDRPSPVSIRGRRRRRILVILAGSAIILALFGGSAAWLSLKAQAISGELTGAAALVEPLKIAISNDDSSGAASVVAQMQVHTAAAKRAADDPLWTLATAAPIVGANFSAVAEVARSADDVATLGLAPLVKVFDSLDWKAVLPSEAGADLGPLKQASPSVASAAHVVKVSAERLDRIDDSNLLPQVADPLNEARDELHSVTGALDAASDAAMTAPKMLGLESPRSYLLMIQNNAETRASGGIPGALAILTVDNGRMSLGAQTSASEFGVVSPPVDVDAEQEAIFSGRLGKFVQDVNLTPDFPTAAAAAQSMWERKTGNRVDGVISVDPVALSYILGATGPVHIKSPEVLALSKSGMPSELNSQNVVRTLLSDVYAKIDVPRVQDAYFASVAQEMFSALSDDKTDPQQLFKGITRGVEESRILIWSNHVEEQSVVGRYSVSGSVTGSSVPAAQFGVYFNDGTGAKMDFYVKRQVQLVKQCEKDGYLQTSVRVTSTNAAPADAASRLPAYVTGDGIFGVPPGTVQTNVVAYGPAQAHIETVIVDGQKTGFAPYLHGTRPVGVYTVRLAPGESQVVEFNFGKIVQHTEPQLVVTPTVQPVNEVTLPTENARCG